MSYKITAGHTEMPQYQVYYWEGLTRVAQVRMGEWPWLYRWLPRPDLALDLEAYAQQGKGLLGMKRRWDNPQLKQFAVAYEAVGKDRSVRFVIDSHDSRDIIAPELLDSCDIYFKANKWRSVHYPDKVLPIVNGNGFLRTRHLNKLKKMRGRGKKQDFLFISRVWGGVEHNIRLFESLADLPCRKKLVAIFVKGTAGEEQTEAAIKRLQSVGVHCTYDLLPIKQLWADIGDTKVVMLRAGKYMCIPWRMIDLLCMGTCIVTDADFEPEWPEPLLQGVHYMSAGIGRPSDTTAAPAAEYAKLTEVVSALLGDAAKIERLQQASASYFDRYASPEKVGHYILDILQQVDYSMTTNIR